MVERRITQSYHLIARKKRRREGTEGFVFVKGGTLKGAAKCSADKVLPWKEKINSQGC